jgi:hypothetical protein
MPVFRAFHEDLDPYSEYKAVKLIKQTNLRTQVVVERRTGDLKKQGRRFIMTVVPLKVDVKDVVDCILDLKHPNIAKVSNFWQVLAIILRSAAVLLFMLCCLTYLSIWCCNFRSLRPTTGMAIFT